ncbi:MAG: M1 family aminopeptidase [Acidobacteriota bacterium]
MKKRFVFTPLFAAVLFTGNLLFAFAQTPAAPPVNWPRSHNYDVQHYRIKLAFNWQEKSIDGETTVYFKPFSEAISAIELDAGNLTIKSVKLAQGTDLNFRYVNNEKLFVTLNKPYAVGSSVAVVINYTANPPEGKGVTFITPTNTDPNRPYQIWSQGEAQTNHYWFPCYDYPNDKATSELIATVENKYQVISNGTLIAVQNHPATKTKTYHWKMTQPFSSYLVSFIVGEFTEVKDRFKNIPVSSYVYKDQVENARISFGKLARMVAFFSKKTGYDYPFSKYAQTTVRDFGGAMENITATTMTDTAVHDHRAHLDVSSDGITAHELAHSWFGNLLTCRDWGELWLNESFATFMEATWTEHDKSRDDYLYEMYGNQKAYFQTWEAGIRRPIVTKFYNDPDALFDTYVYPRGAAVVNMLRFVLGEENFWKAIQHYVKKHQYQNVETQQLVVAIEETTGQNLQWFFDEWLYKMGHPEFEITSSYDEAAKQVKLVVNQTQKPDEQRKGFASTEFFTMPVDIAITTATGEKVHRVWIDRKEEEFIFAVDGKPQFINFDKGNYLIKKIKFTRTDAELATQLLNDTDVMGRVLAANELKGKTSDVAIKALSEAMLKDKFAGVRVEAANALAEIQSEATKAVFIEALNDKESSVRRAAVKGLAKFKDEKLADRFINIINHDASYFAVADAAEALGQTASPKAYDQLTNAAKLKSWQGTIQAGAVKGLAALKDSRSFDVALQFAAPGNLTETRAEAMMLLAAIGKGKDPALELLTGALKDPSPQIKFTALQALITLGDARAIPAIEELAKSPGLPPFANQFITNAINQLKAASTR